MTHLCANAVVLEGFSLFSCPGGLDLREKRFVDGHVYWAKDIDFLRSDSGYIVMNGVGYLSVVKMLNCLLCHRLVPE